MSRPSYQILQHQNPGKYPARMGAAWKDDEIQKLLQNVKKGLSFEQIAEEHQRTRGSITSRLRELAADYYMNDDRSIDEIKKFTGLDEEVIMDAIERRKWADKQKEQKGILKAEKVKATPIHVALPVDKSSEILAELQKITGLLTELVNLQKTKVDSPKKIIVKPKPMFVEDE